MLKHYQAKDKAKKLILKMNRGSQAISQQENQYKREQSKDKNTPNLEKKILSPVWLLICYEENISMDRGKPQET